MKRSILILSAVSLVLGLVIGAGCWLIAAVFARLGPAWGVSLCSAVGSLVTFAGAWLLFTWVDWEGER